VALLGVPKRYRKHAERKPCKRYGCGCHYPKSVEDNQEEAGGRRKKEIGSFETLPGVGKRGELWENGFLEGSSKNSN